VSQKGIRLKKPIVYISSRSFGKITSDGLRILERVAEIGKNPLERHLTESELIEKVENAVGVIAGSEKHTSRVISAAKHLKVIGRHGVGVDNIDLKTATKKGVIVTYTPLANTESVADLTLAALLALTRMIPMADKSVKEGDWSPLKFIGMELLGKKIGIIGLGNVGSKVAKRAASFGMKILAYDPYIDEGKAKDLGAKLVELATLLKESDVVTIHVPLVKETIGMIGEKELKMMKSEAFLINVARGKIVDEKALVEALKRGEIKGAAVDVFEKEPPDPDNPLLKLDNVILTPHIGAYTLEAIRRMDITVAMDVAKVLKGKKPDHIVNPEVLSQVRS